MCFTITQGQELVFFNITLVSPGKTRGSAGSNWIGRRRRWLSLGRYLSALAESKDPRCENTTSTHITSCQRTRPGGLSHATWSVDDAPQAAQLGNAQQDLTLTGGDPNTQSLFSCSPELPRRASPGWSSGSPAPLFVSGDCSASLEMQVVVLVSISLLPTETPRWPAVGPRASTYSSTGPPVCPQVTVAMEGVVWKWTHMSQIPFLPVWAKGLREHWLLLLKTPQNTTSRTSAFPNSHTHYPQNKTHFLSASLAEALTNQLRPSRPTYGFSF